MRRKKNKMALYEVIGQGRLDVKKDRPVEPLHPQKPKEQPSTPKAEPEQKPAVSEKLTRWPRKPKPVQVNGNRIEFSLPWQLAVLGGLIVLLLLVLFYNLGRSSAVEQSNSPAAGQNTASLDPSRNTASVNPQSRTLRQVPTTVEPSEQPKTVNPVQPAPAAQGDNCIVIQQYQAKADLVPVQEFFSKNGIATEIRQIGSVYYLISRDRYETTHRGPGRDALRKIIEVGSQYKAPQGYETFGPKPFHDAYGMKIK